MSRRISELLTKDKIKNILNSPVTEKVDFRIVTEQARYPLNNVKEIFQSYDLDPYYQRNIVWQNSKKSKLIESFIINIPIPPIFLFEYDYGKYEIMDGKQRISTIISFLDDEFALESLEFFPEYEGMNFSNLPAKIQDMITRRYISATILLSESTKNEFEKENMRRLVFERLNTGGLALNKQEVRNALYTGKFNDLINRLAENNIFKELWSPAKKDEYNNRLEYSEKVVRFFAYYSAINGDITPISTSKLLDLYMEASKDWTESDIAELEGFFIAVITTVKRLFGKKAFRSSLSKSKAENMVYDSTMLFVANELDRLESLTDLMFEESKFSIIKENKSDFNGKYTAISNVKSRVDIFKRKLLENE
ncbi:GmrSD restriction endonuclease domain-containing protein [Streptococcus iners]|uniref:DUF262 domain-containing protein n=1 Tax=Streptococcus iners subsp. hyiners TaxID=3028083 RepID=A0AA97A212_9STRE|nr:DUF262 domain-containing protein [Streptococcus sp. 29892]MCK4029471.1 DUF262 domain-containing protein [Streptococcus suis]WNY49129.1 DUF262 domain-containing protein [Streptococcus sp. 29892]